MPGARSGSSVGGSTSVQNTKKITRAMELIAATRVVKAQQRGQRARPYSEHITAGDPATSPPAAPTSTTRCCARSSDVDKVGIVVLRCRPWPGRRATTRPSSGPPSARSRPPASEGKDYALVTVGRKAEGYFRFRGYAIEASLRRLLRPARPTRTPATVAADVTELFVDGGCRPGRPRLHPASSRSAPRRSVVRRFLPLETDARTIAEARATAARPGRVRVRAVGRRGARAAAAPLRRGPALRRPARRGRLGARQPAAGHEVGHRQRRGADHQLQPPDEPGPPGRHHHRDHGDHRRRRGARRRPGRAPRTCSSTTCSPTRSRRHRRACTTFAHDRPRPIADRVPDRSHSRSTPLARQDDDQETQ